MYVSLIGEHMVWTHAQRQDRWTPGSCSETLVYIIQGDPSFVSYVLAHTYNKCYVYFQTMGSNCAKAADTQIT